MKQLVILLLAYVCSGALPTHAQKLISDQIVPVKGYDIRQFGYPSSAVPGESGQFIYLQYWRRDDLHPTNNHYLQCLKNVNYEGQWYQAITAPGVEEVQEPSLHRLEKSVVVTGKQYLPKRKSDHTVGRFFQLNGKPLSKHPIQLSIYEKKPSKDFKETFHVSPNRKCIMWSGHDEKNHFFSVYDGAGKKMWDTQLDLSHWTGKRYDFKQVLVNDDGMPFILLQLKKPTYSIKDTLYPPVLLHYDPAHLQFRADTLKLDSAFVINMQAEMLDNNELVIASILGQGDPGGLLNGAKTGTAPQYWNQIGVKHYRWQDSLFVIHSDSVSDIPQGWAEKYGAEGSNFVEGRLHVRSTRERKQVVWVFEEIYKVKKRTFLYDMACFGLDLQHGTVKWTTRIEKRQRSERGLSLLSYTGTMTKWSISFIYLSERGARGKMVCSTVDLTNGKRRDKWLASNEAAAYLFFPKQSAKVSDREVVLIGMGNPGQNDYKLMTVLLE